MTTAAGSLLRWRLRLAELDFKVKYTKGANHHVPDALSRIPTSGLDHKELDDDIPCFLLAQAARGMDDNNFSEPVPPSPITADELLRAQGADGGCKQLRGVIDSGKPTRFVLDEEGRLVSRQPKTDVMQVYIPEALRARVMGLEHYPTSKGHPGVQCMYASMKRCFYLGVADCRPVRLRPAMPTVREEPATGATSCFPHDLVPATGTAERGSHRHPLPAAQHG